MSDDFSFVFSRESALAAFPGSTAETLVQALLAGVAPEDRIEGCMVFLGEAPDDPARHDCVGTKGPHADEVQRLLVERLEDLGVAVDVIFEGGPVPQTILAVARGGRWVRPEPAK